MPHIRRECTFALTWKDTKLNWVIIKIHIGLKPTLEIILFSNFYQKEKKCLKVLFSNKVLYRTLKKNKVELLSMKPGEQGKAEPDLFNLLTEPDILHQSPRVSQESTVTKDIQGFAYSKKGWSLQVKLRSPGTSPYSLKAKLPLTP